MVELQETHLSLANTFTPVYIYQLTEVILTFIQSTARSETSDA